MCDSQETDSALQPYRVLDLTEGGCMIGARILGDLGADVIKIEPPGGSPSRVAPYYKDIPHPEKSLFWFAYNANKRGITLDKIKVDGREKDHCASKLTQDVVDCVEGAIQRFVITRTKKSCMKKEH